jgi:hypothetical protein
MRELPGKRHSLRSVDAAHYRRHSFLVCAETRSESLHLLLEVTLILPGESWARPLVGQAALQVSAVTGRA